MSEYLTLKPSSGGFDVFEGLRRIAIVYITPENNERNPNSIAIFYIRIIDIESGNTYGHWKYLPLEKIGYNREGLMQDIKQNRIRKSVLMETE